MNLAIVYNLNFYSKYNKKVLGLAIAATGFLTVDIIGGELNLGYTDFGHSA